MTNTFEDYNSIIEHVKFAEIPSHFKNQFKQRETMLNASSKNFQSIVNKFLKDETVGEKRKWDKQAKLFFIWFIVKYFQAKKKRVINPSFEDWDFFEQVLGVNKEVLKSRWITLINPQTKSMSWNPKEDDIIRGLMKQRDFSIFYPIFNMDFEFFHILQKKRGQACLDIDCSGTLQLESWEFRKNTKISERKMDELFKSQIKKVFNVSRIFRDQWSNEEDLNLLNLVVSNGKRWSYIASLCEGRTENQVKNRYKSLINKIIKNDEEEEQDEIKAIQEFVLLQTQHSKKEENWNINLDDENKQYLVNAKDNEKITRPSLKRSAKDKQLEYFQIQKQKDDLVERILQQQEGKIQNGENEEDEQNISKSLKISKKKGQNMKQEQQEPQINKKVKTEEEKILLGEITVDNRKESSTPSSINQLKVGQINLVTPDQLNQNIYGQQSNKPGFKPYQQFDRSPLEQNQQQLIMMSPVFPQTPQSFPLQTPVDLFSKLVRGNQFGISPMNIFPQSPFNTSNQGIPSNYIYQMPQKSPYDLSPLPNNFNPLYQPKSPLISNTPRQDEIQQQQIMLGQLQAMRNQMSPLQQQNLFAQLQYQMQLQMQQQTLQNILQQQSQQTQQVAAQQPVKNIKSQQKQKQGFDFLGEKNLISKWKNRDKNSENKEQ